MHLFLSGRATEITDLVNGYDAVQFALDQGTTFWGHMLVDNAAIRVALTDGHPDLGKLGFAEFTATVKVKPLAGLDGFTLTLDCPSTLAALIAGVDFQGWYHGYDENGNLQRLDWHGYSKSRKAMGLAGQLGRCRKHRLWDASLLPAQQDVAVRAAVRFKADANLVFLTAATTGLRINERCLGQSISAGAS